MTGKEFAEWMDRSGIRLDEAADYFGVSEQTIYKWRSTRGVPESRTEWVRSRIAEYKTEATGSLRSLVLDIDRETFRRWNQAALDEKKLMEDWAHDALEDAADELYSSAGNELRSVKAAEPTPESDWLATSPRKTKTGTLPDP